jgi:hypothetical protein
MASVQLTAQSDMGFPYTGWAYNDDGMPCENSQVDLIVRFIDLLDNDKEVYKESFSTMTNERGQFTANVGKGDVKAGEFDMDYLTKPRYKMVIDLIVDCNGQEVVILDRDVTRPRVPVAEDAENWGGHPAPDRSSDTTGWKQFLNGPYAWTLPVFASDSMGHDSTKLVTPMALKENVTLSDLCDFSPAQELMTPAAIQKLQDENNGSKEIYMDIFGSRFILGNNALIPISTYPDYSPLKLGLDTSSGYSVITPIIPLNDPNYVVTTNSDAKTFNSKWDIYIPTLGELINGFEVSIGDEEEDAPPNPGFFRSQASHTTSAIAGTNPVGTTGLFGAGGTFGSFSQGGSGSFAVTLNDGLSGAGIWGTIGFQPTTTNFAYAVLADANNFPSSAQAWAFAGFGDGFITGTFSQMSDARLKHDVRAPMRALDKILALQPKQYRYVQNTGFGLPEGEHYGFLAQDVEKIIPEIVSDILVPSSLDKHSLANVETEEYKAINYTELIPILTKAMQELNDKVDAQSVEIKRLSAIIEELKRD